MIETAKILLRYLIIISIFFIIYLLLFSTFLFKSDTVLFYRGIKLLFFELFLFFLGAFYLTIQKKSFIESYFASVATASSICLVFLTVFPVTVDRSITTFLLNTVNNPTISCKQGGISKENLKKVFIEDFFKREDAIGRRLNEQEVTGSIVKIKDGCFKITPKGRKLVSFFNLIKQYFIMKQ
ncbi:hypothetical protein A2690_05090 [Candidatus Roizmanbacteria bacterium RIFCSPHIGHO2_01_FULL_39_12b]|uniref:Uncharacterized protein n=1 Tax=Candidatus Roizmanbacteria bacterium RIFCSPHIGHO2_01_FULL_39_12b TaxID=1802030 RepID=A0A1F7G9U8_9BACT|nr:MAG: hypothetical protein A2690_05090 [Candidatus Roizmanbacteria bacterium RIFCSPHIGHO2_01_FULL_39_12b]OGK45913.1 MAG: hypothetical protein A3B46_03400 [Candidatus Roizmanbacteria bacterium RIFCSPLOWO2_01_FULL_39_19]